jgi:hypothetical protein
MSVLPPKLNASAAPASPVVGVERVEDHPTAGFLTHAGIRLRASRHRTRVPANHRQDELVVLIEEHGLRLQPFVLTQRGHRRRGPSGDRVRDRDLGRGGLGDDRQPGLGDMSEVLLDPLAPDRDRREGERLKRGVERSDVGASRPQIDLDTVDELVRVRADVSG